MTSTFQSQLAHIATTQTNELDLRARRTAHSLSLIFAPEVAIKQSWDTLYSLCYTGFIELCALDDRFEQFRDNLFAESSKTQDREGLNKRQNADLDLVLGRCLRLLGGRLNLRPGVRALEWLVRRFGVGRWNVTELVLSGLCWCEERVWGNLLGVVDEAQLRDEWKWLRAYRGEQRGVPRSVVVHASVNNEGFWRGVNNYAVELCQEGVEHQGFMRWWGALVVEGTVGRLKAARSGRREVQRQRTEDVLLKVLPVLNDGLAVEDCAEMTITCYTLAMVMAGTELLEDTVLNKMAEAVVQTIDYREIELRQTLITLSVLVTNKSWTTFTPRVTRALCSAGRLSSVLQLLSELKKEHDIQPLMLALTSGLLNGTKPENVQQRTKDLEAVLDASPSLITAEYQGHLLGAVGIWASGKDANHPACEPATRTQIVKVLQQLYDSGRHAEAFVTAAKELKEAGTELQQLLQTYEAPQAVETARDDDEMDVDDQHQSRSEIDRVLDALPSSLPDVDGLFLFPNQDIFQQCLSALQQCVRVEGGLHRFRNLELWQNTTETSLNFIRFLVSVSLGSRPKLAAIALHLLSEYVEQAPKLDTQDLLPCVTICLGSSHLGVRRAASDLVLAMKKAAPETLVQGDICRKTALLPHESSGLDPFSSSHLVKILEQAYIPVLEECGSDPQQIAFVLQHILNGSPARHPEGLKATDLEMKKTFRQDLFRSLLRQVVAMASWTVKVGLLEILDGVDKVGSLSKFDTVLDLLRSWAALSSAQVQAICEEEDLDSRRADRALCSILPPEDGDAVRRLLDLLTKPTFNQREALVDAAYARLHSVWPKLETGPQQRVCVQLFEMSFNTDPEVSQPARAVLRQLQYTTEALHVLIDTALKAITDMPREAPPKKRQRTSLDDESENAVSAALILASPRLAFALEVVESSNIESRPELMPVLFDVLVMLTRMKLSQQTELPYLFNLCLSTILAITKKAQAARRPNIDLSAIRADIVTDVFRTAENPQVQASALQLASSLASLAPDRVIHNLMPIFTFTSTKLITKDDEHSVNVIHQAIDQIIPPLVLALKKQDPQNLVLSTKGILASFAAAYDHISQPRRAKLYQRLLRRLGPEDFTYALVSMLVTRRTEDQIPGKFLHEVVAVFDPVVQIITYSRIVALTSDVLATTPREAGALLNLDKIATVEEKQEVALTLYATAEHLIRSKQLRPALVKRARLNDDFAQQIKDQLRVCLHQILELMQSQSPHGDKVVFSARTCLSALLELMPAAQLMSSVSTLFKEMIDEGEDLKPQVLRVVAAQLRSKVPSDDDTVTAAVTLFTELRQTLAGDNHQFKLASLACIDQLAESYGRKLPEKMLEMAEHLSSGVIADLGDRSVTVAAALTLASIVDILGEAAVPVVPTALQNVFIALSQSLEQGEEDEQLHNASFATISSIVSNVAFMVSDEDLDRLLELSAEAAFSDLPTSCSETRRDFFEVLARKTELSALTGSITRSWEKIVENDVAAVLPSLELLASAVDSSSKSTVANSSELISTLILQILELRRVQFTDPSEESYSEANITTIGTHLNTFVLKFVYKLNDTIFRPLFESWISWANPTSTIDLDIPTTLRLTSLFSLLTHFFITLKSIVTSYSASILPTVNTLLTHFTSDPTSHTTQPHLYLYTNLLATLTATLTHDADAFYAGPTHFHPLCTNLTSQLNLASHKSFRPLVFESIIPAIVALAIAVQDTASHHLHINHALVQLRHSESSHVRLASIRTYIAITENEEVGEEWLGNVVSGAAGDIDDDVVGGGIGAGAEGSANAKIKGGSGETMIYVNEMLEDDDEVVEAEVRRWVRMVREVVGEEVFEF